MGLILQEKAYIWKEAQTEFRKHRHLVDPAEIEKKVSGKAHIVCLLWEHRHRNYWSAMSWTLTSHLMRKILTACTGADFRRTKPSGDGHPLQDTLPTPAPQDCDTSISGHSRNNFWKIAIVDWLSALSVLRWEPNQLQKLECSLWKYTCVEAYSFWQSNNACHDPPDKTMAVWMAALPYFWTVCIKVPCSCRRARGFFLVTSQSTSSQSMVPVS